MNILILAAGQEQISHEDKYPLCLTEFDSVPLIQRLLELCNSLSPQNVIVALHREEVRRYHLDNVISLLMPDSVILNIQAKTQGAACTALLAIGMIDNNDELLIINGNELLDINFSDVIDGFRSRSLDAGVVIFSSIHPRYSYVRIDKDGFVEEAAEKNPISKNATVGFYWFSRGKIFVKAAKNLIKKDAHVNGFFYICPVFNELILEQQRIGTHLIDEKNYHPLKTERQWNKYEATLERDKSYDS